MNQYIVQNYIQIIDLYENLSTQSNLAIKLVSDNNFMYSFASAQQVQNENMENASFSQTNQISVIINSDKRYLLLKAATPTIVNLERIETSDQVELFGELKAGSTTHFLVMIFIVTILVFLASAGFLYYLKAHRGVEFQRANYFDDFRNSPSYTATKSNWANVASELRKIYQNSLGQ